jgi:hypothetical protein
MRPNLLPILSITLSLAQPAKADDFTMLDLGGASVVSDSPWVTEITGRTQWEAFFYGLMRDCQEITVDPAPVTGPDCNRMAPVVDFETHKVYVGGLGAMPSTANSILISSVDSSGDEQRINVVTMDWGVELTVIDYPTVAFSVPKTDKPVKFIINEARVITQDQ